MLHLCRVRRYSQPQTADGGADASSVLRHPVLAAAGGVARLIHHRRSHLQRLHGGVAGDGGVAGESHQRIRVQTSGHDWYTPHSDLTHSVCLRHFTHTPLRLLLPRLWSVVYSLVLCISCTLYVMVLTFSKYLTVPV